MERPACERIDYSNLNKFLEAKDWISADRETNYLLLTSCRRTNRGWIRIEDIEAIDCFDLFLLDRLWYSHSEGRFGFGIQLAIYQEYFGNLEQISFQLKWNFEKNQNSLNKSLIFNSENSSGFFPNLYLNLGNGSNSNQRVDSNWFEAFFERLALCKI